MDSTAPDCSPNELMIVSAARALAAARTVFVGVGLPNIACNLARRTSAPQLELVYESGVVGARPARLPLSIGDPALVTGAALACSMADLFMYYLQAGRIDVALLGTAQIDRFGNLNTTVIGEYSKPKTRLPGSGGACEIALNAQEFLVITALNKRTFVAQLDFCTSPGRPPIGSGAATHARGARLVITDRAIFDFGAASQEMRLISVHPGQDARQIRELVAWPLQVAAQVAETAMPSAAELQLLRTELDPHGLYR